MAGSLTVVDRKFVSEYPTKLSVTRKVLSVSDGDFAVTDHHGKALFKVKGKLISLNETRVLRDSHDTPLVSLKKKHISIHETWEAHRAETKDPLFTMKKASINPLNTHAGYDVFLEGSSGPDVQVKGDIIGRNYAIYYHDSLIAEVSTKFFSISSLTHGKNKYGVSIAPEIDQAFISAVVVLMDSIKKDDKQSKGDDSSSDSD